MNIVICPNCGFRIEFGVMNKPTACPKCNYIINMNGVGGVWS